MRTDGGLVAPLSPARGPPTEWAELVQAHDERDAMQASPDDLPVIDIHSLCPVPDARHRSPGTGGLGSGLRRGEKIAIAGGEWRFGKPSLDAQAAPPCAHESLVSWETIAEVPLTGLSFCRFTVQTPSRKP